MEDITALPASSSAVGHFAHFSAVAAGAKSLLVFPAKSQQVFSSHRLVTNQVLISFDLHDTTLSWDQILGNYLIIIDRMFSNQPNETFYAYDKDGNSLIEYIIKSSVFNSAISNDGKFAACSTYRVEGIDMHSNMLLFFDLQNSKFLWSISLDLCMPQEILFDETHDSIDLVYSYGIICKYSFEGGLLEVLSVENTDVREDEKKASGLTCLAKSGRYHDKEEIIRLYTNALNQDKNPEHKAYIHRNLGEFYEFLQEKKMAIKHYQDAIALYPKIGLKKHLQKLLKEHGDV